RRHRRGARAAGERRRGRVIDLGWGTETDEEFCARVAAGDVTGRLRVIGEVPGLWEAAADERAEVTPLTGEVLASGRRELLCVLREQAIARTRHRFGPLTTDRH